MSSTEISSEQPKKSIYSEFTSSHENLLTDDVLLVTYDEETEDDDRKIQATQVVDCTVIAMWGKTKEGKNFVSLIHKSSPSTVEKLFNELGDEAQDSDLSYLVIPGPESSKRVIAKTKEECKKLFAKAEAEIDTQTGGVNLRIEQHERPYDKATVLINGLPNGEVQIITVCPSPEDIREKMANSEITPNLANRDKQ